MAFGTAQTRSECVCWQPLQVTGLGKADRNQPIQDLQAKPARFLLRIGANKKNNRTRFAEAFSALLPIITP